MELWNRLKEKFSAFVYEGCKNLRQCVDSLKLSGEKSRVDGEIRRRYEELGRTIYESKGENMTACREICDRIDELNDRREELLRRDILLPGRVRCRQCGTIMGKKAKFCVHCGAAMPEISDKITEE